MNPTIFEREDVRALNPGDVSLYLQMKGWRKTADLGDKGSVWLLGHGNASADLMLPMRRDLKDFELRMSQLIRTLVDVEKRAAQEILTDISVPSADVVRVRVFSDDDSSGTLALERAVLLVKHALELIAAAACSAVEKKSHFASRKPQQVTRYLSQVRMGQTEFGSFVLTILTPVPPALAQHEMPELGSEPYERRVTRTLVGALTALGEAAHAAGPENMQPFVDAVDDGVSANLCDAIVGLVSTSPDHEIDIGISWSKARPQPEQRTVRIGADDAALIAEAAKHFRETAILEDFELHGFVTNLERGPLVTEGDIKVSEVVGGKVRKISIRLDSRDYAAAAAAHVAIRPIKCIGELVKHGRGLRLESPRQFEVMEDPETSD